MATAHPGFEAIAQRMAKSGGYSVETARKILAYKTRHASAKSKKVNPRLKRVK